MGNKPSSESSSPPYPIKSNTPLDRQYTSNATQNTLNTDTNNNQDSISNNSKNSVTYPNSDLVSGSKELTCSIPINVNKSSSINNNSRGNSPRNDRNKNNMQINTSSSSRSIKIINSNDKSDKNPPTSSSLNELSFLNIFSKSPNTNKLNPNKTIAKSPNTNTQNTSNSNTTELGSFIKDLFTSSSINHDQSYKNTSSPASSQYFSQLENLFSNRQGSSSANYNNNNTSLHNILSLSSRQKILERDGNLYAVLNGRLIQLRAPKTCTICKKVINPLQEDFEIHLVKCMTKPRVNFISFELTEEKDSDLVGEECTICFEEYAIGETLARLECFCVYHKTCLNNWLSRKQCCPLHLHVEDEDEDDKK